MSAHFTVEELLELDGAEPSSERAEHDGGGIGWQATRSENGREAGHVVACRGSGRVGPPIHRNPWSMPWWLSFL